MYQVSNRKYHPHPRCLYLYINTGQLTNATLIPIAEPKTYDRKTSICNAIVECKSFFFLFIGDNSFLSLLFLMFLFGYDSYVCRSM